MRKNYGMYVTQAAENVLRCIDRFEGRLKSSKIVAIIAELGYVWYEMRLI